MTARFRESRNNLSKKNIKVALLAWMPEKIIFGRPKIVAVCITDALSIADSRDSHYFNPPDYLVVEPEDTASRTCNLQQRNVNGLKWQGSIKEFESAKKIVEKNNKILNKYNATKEQQESIKELVSNFSYRLDTNFAKIDRIVHEELEEFKENTSQLNIAGRTIEEWSNLMTSETEIDHKIIEALL